MRTACPSQYSVHIPVWQVRELLGHNTNNQRQHNYIWPLHKRNWHTSVPFAHKWSSAARSSALALWLRCSSEFRKPSSQTPRGWRHVFRSFLPFCRLAVTQRTYSKNNLTASAAGRWMQSSIRRVAGHRRTAFPWSALGTLLFHHFQTCCSPRLMFSSRTSTFGSTCTCRLCPTGDRRTSVTSLSPHRAVSLVLQTPRLAALSRAKRQDVRLARLCTTWTLLIVYSPTKFVGTLHVFPARWCT